MSEMRDIEELVKHILYLEGLPNLQRIDAVKVGENVLEHLGLDLESEKAAVEALTEGVSLCVEVGDYGTRSRFEEVIRDEETHIDWLESQIEPSARLGLSSTSPSNSGRARRSREARDGDGVPATATPRTRRRSPREVPGAPPHPRTRRPARGVEHEQLATTPSSWPLLSLSRGPSRQTLRASFSFDGPHPTLPYSSPLARG